MIALLNNIKQKIKIELGINESIERKIAKLFKDKRGIEIGGPSPIFSADLPIYPVIKGLDGCNFSNDTIWEGNIEEGFNYKYYQDKRGYQYISEASNLKEISSNKYDFLLASHCLEHCANTLKTMQEWVRVIKPRGYILLILPDKQHTFDHKRPITSFEHLLEDYKNNIDERDLTHLDEILGLHDLTLDPPAGDFNHFKQRSLINYQNRCLHHHVFDFKLLEQIFSFFHLKIKFEVSMSLHQIIVGKKAR